MAIRRAGRAAWIPVVITAAQGNRQVSDGLWFELRLGRARAADGSKLENKAMFTLKFSPESTLEAQAKKAK